MRSSHTDKRFSRLYLVGEHSHRRSIIRSTHMMMLQTTEQTGNRRPEASAQLRLRWRANRVAGDTGPNRPENDVVNVLRAFWIRLQTCKIKKIPNVATFCLCLWTCILQWAHQQDGLRSLTAPPPHYKHITLFIRSMLQSVPQTKALAWIRIWSLGTTWSLHAAPQGWAEWEQAPLWLHVTNILLYLSSCSSDEMKIVQLWVWDGDEITSLFLVLPEEHTSDHGRTDQRCRKAWTKSISDLKTYWMFSGSCPCSVSGSDLIWLETQWHDAVMVSGLKNQYFVFPVWQGTKSAIKLSVNSDGIHKRAVPARGRQAIVSVCCDVVFNSYLPWSRLTNVRAETLKTVETPKQKHILCNNR